MNSLRKHTALFSALAVLASAHGALARAHRIDPHTWRALVDRPYGQETVDEPGTPSIMDDHQTLTGGPSGGLPGTS
jgi:hypothetical protein